MERDPSPIRRPLNMRLANLSFWISETPISLGQLDSAAELLVKVCDIFKELYIDQGVTYRAFCRQALKRLSAVEINYRIVPQSVNKTVEAYSRVYDVLTEHREHVIEAFKRKSSFDTEAALFLLEICEKRIYRGHKANVSDYPSDLEYNNLAECANGFGIFSSPISGQALMDFRDGTLAEPLSADNMSKAVFFLSILERLRFIPRKWKHMAVSNSMLLKSKDGKIPTLHYLQIAAERNRVELYLEDSTSSKYFSRESSYLSLSRAIKNALKRKS